MMQIEGQLEVIRRGSAEIISEDELKEKLQESISRKRPLRVKAGFDPTAPDIHLGHTVLLRKLRQFQDLGHQVYFLIGDFTARIGDPSGRSEKRKQMSQKEISRNAATYKKQIFKIIDKKRTKIVFNSGWFDKMRGLEFGRLLTHYTATRLLERDDFTLRIKEKKPLYMSELVYPILQGYDSVVLEADIEVGGTDQKFNLIVGRELQKDFGQRPQSIITLPLLEGTDGVNKMSKSSGNYIGINEPASEMFGKIMSISDDLMKKYYELLTAEDLEAIKAMHPKEAKLKLAQNIVGQYHGQDGAVLARQEFERVFSQKELPRQMPEYKTDGTKTVIAILLNSGLVTSGNEARRLVKQGAVFFDNSLVEKDNFTPQRNGILKAGTRRFLKVTI